MNCPVCNAWTEILDTRKKLEGVVRRRKCGNEHTFSTIETVLTIKPKRKKKENQNDHSNKNH